MIDTLHDKVSTPFESYEKALWPYLTVPAVVPLPWREELFAPEASRKLRVGWYDSDGVFPVVPGCKRALSEVLQVIYIATNKSSVEFINIFSRNILPV